MLVIACEPARAGHVLRPPSWTRAPAHPSAAALPSARWTRCRHWSTVGLAAAVMCKMGQQLATGRGDVRRAAAAGRTQGLSTETEVAVPRQRAQSKVKTKPLTLFKELQSLGIAGRKYIVALIKQGRVQIDGAVVKDPEMMAPAGAMMTLDGIPLDREPPLLLKFHKPFDVISSMSDHQGRQDLSSLPGMVPPWHPDVDEGDYRRRKEQLRLEEILPPVLTSWICVDQYHPVGRLDRDTTGLLLFSRDGKLTTRLLNPVRGVPRCYTAVVQGDAFKLDSEGRSLEERLAAGIVTYEGTFPGRLLSSEALPPAELDPREREKSRDRKARAAKGAAAEEDMEQFEIDPKAVRSRVVLEVKEGKYRMVRKMLWRCGLPVLELHRTQYGQVALGDLPVGGLARATAAEEEWANTIL